MSDRDAERALRGLTSRVAKLSGLRAFVVERPPRAQRAESLGEVYELPLTRSAQHRTRERATEAIDGLARRRLCRYEPGYHATRDELLVLARAEAPLVEHLIGSLDSATLPRVSESSARVEFIGVCLGRGSQAVVCLQRVTARHVLDPDRVLWLWRTDTQFDIQRERGFGLDFQFDALLFGDWLFATTATFMEDQMRFDLAVAAEARQNAGRLTAMLQFANPDEFANACASDHRLARKLALIVNSHAFQYITEARLRKFAQEKELELPLNADGKFEFRSNVQERWRLLSVLDDGFLTSGLTGEEYEVNSKRTRISETRSRRRSDANT